MQRLRAAGALHLRVACNIAAHEMVHLAGLGLRTGFGDDYLRLGHVKVFADSITPGKCADLIVVDRDLFALTTEEVQAGAVAAAGVTLTLFDGAVVYRAG